MFIDRQPQAELWSWRKQQRFGRDYCTRPVSRNIYRDQPQSFAYDSLALALAQEAISLATRCTA